MHHVRYGIHTTTRQQKAVSRMPGEAGPKYGLEYPITYDNPTDIKQYEYKLRKRNIERFRDRIVATGYAERQKAKTLEMVGRVKI